MFFSFIHFQFVYFIFLHFFFWKFSLFHFQVFFSTFICNLFFRSILTSFFQFTLTPPSDFISTQFYFSLSFVAFSSPPFISFLYFNCNLLSEFISFFIPFSFTSSFLSLSLYLSITSSFLISTLIIHPFSIVSFSFFSPQIGFDFLSLFFHSFLPNQSVLLLIVYIFDVFNTQSVTIFL